MKRSCWAHATHKFHEIHVVHASPTTSAASGLQPELPATEFTAGRLFVYRKSQQGRNALAEESYAVFFDKGEIGD